MKNNKQFLYTNTHIIKLTIHFHIILFISIDTATSAAQLLKPLRSETQFTSPNLDICLKQ